MRMNYTFRKITKNIGAKDLKHINVKSSRDLFGSKVMKTVFVDKNKNSFQGIIYFQGIFVFMMFFFRAILSFESTKLFIQGFACTP
eukprot:UN26978